jgi:S-adenosylmethionine:tRNA ribosyltransferase-isomerase
MKLSEFDFELPKEYIAQEPCKKRDGSRLMVLSGEKIEHRVFSDLPAYLSPGDCVVINKTKVIPAKISCRKSTGGKVELIMLRKTGDNTWTALSRDHILQKELSFPDGTAAKVAGSAENGEFIIQFNSGAVVDAILENFGSAPLPPYIKGTRTDDRTRYQTVYAKIPGSVAAPTAGLHFTEELLNAIRAQGAVIAEILLHVGWGTFKPVKAEDVSEHVMLPEEYEVTDETAGLINKARRNGKRIFAVGTSSVRTLETLTDNNSELRPSKGRTDLYIYPGYRFKAVDGLITNFHLPRSTPLLLACAFCGRERLLSAYRSAIENKYRFYSYGDAMLVLNR